MYSDNDDPKGPGFPIRISPDQSSFAAPRSFSQRITSFIASRCQGIHQTPLRRLTDPTSNDQRPMLRIGYVSRLIHASPCGSTIRRAFQPIRRSRLCRQSGTAQHLQSALIQLHRAPAATPIAGAPHTRRPRNWINTLFTMSKKHRRPADLTPQSKANFRPRTEDLLSSIRDRFHPGRRCQQRVSRQDGGPGKT